MDNLQVGDIIEFDNGLVHGEATITKIASKSAFKKANGELIRYVLNFKNTTQICSPSEVIKKL